MYNQDQVNVIIEDLVRSCHFTTSIIGVFILLYLWYSHYYRQNRKTTKIQDLDFGLLLLAGGYLIWATQDLMSKSILEKGELTEAIFSMLSDYLFLASFVYFEFGFKIVERLKRKRNWFFFLILLFFTGLLTCFLFKEYAHVIQTITTIFVIVFTGLLLVITFYHRNLSGISGLAILIVFADLISQLTVALGIYLELYPNINAIWKQLTNFNIIFLPSLYIISHSSILILFIMLAFSWFLSNSGALEKFKLNDNLDKIIDIELSKTGNKETKLSEQSLAKLLNRLLVEFFDINQVCERLCAYYSKTQKKDLCAEVRQIQTRFNIVAESIKGGIADRQEYIERNGLIFALQEHIQKLWE